MFHGEIYNYRMKITVKNLISKNYVIGRKQSIRDTAF